jgi:Leucine-rich repeat (LRR) protein
MSLKKLELLDLSYNDVEYIESEAFSGLSSIRIIKLNFNLIKKLDGALFYKLINLEELNLDNNEIDGMISSVYSAGTASFLNLSTNRLKQFSIQNEYLCQFKNIDLSCNFLTQIDSTSFNCGSNSLEILKLGFNFGIEFKQGWFTNLNKLKFLNLTKIMKNEDIFDFSPSFYPKNLT